MLGGAGVAISVSFDTGAWIGAGELPQYVPEQRKPSVETTARICILFVEYIFFKPERGEVVTRRSRERELRRQVILEAAERIFGSRPYHEATMQAIAAASELGMQGLYDQFPSKQALYEEVVVHRAHGYQQRMDAALSGLVRPVEQLEAIARVRAELFAAAPAFLPVFLVEKIRLDWERESRVSGRVRRAIREERERLMRIIEHGIALGELRQEDPSFLAHCFTDAVTAALYVFREHPEEGIRSCTERAMRAFLSGAGVSS